MQVELNPLLFVAITVFRNSLVETEHYGHKSLYINQLQPRNHALRQYPRDLKDLPQALGTYSYGYYPSVISFL